MLIITLKSSKFVELAGVIPRDEKTGLSPNSTHFDSTSRGNLVRLLLVRNPNLIKWISFQSLLEAYLTYPYHCCAFEFPATHDPDQHALHKVSRSSMTF